jgi:hypothetical protein
LSLSFSCSFCFSFELFLALLCHFAWFAAFVLLLALQFFPLLDDLLELFLAFGLLAVLHGVLDLNFELYAFSCQWTLQGKD